MLNVIRLSVIMLTVIMLSVIMLNVIMLSVIMLSVIMLSVIMLSVIMLNVIIFSVIMLSVAALHPCVKKHKLSCINLPCHKAQKTKNNVFRGLKAHQLNMQQHKLGRKKFLTIRIDILNFTCLMDLCVLP
jgi:hypothetical protein